MSTVVNSLGATHAVSMRYTAGIARAWRARGIHFVLFIVPTGILMSEEGWEARFEQPYDGHWTRAGCEAAADAMFEHLARTPVVRRHDSALPRLEQSRTPAR